MSGLSRVLVAYAAVYGRVEVEFPDIIMSKGSGIVGSIIDFACREGSIAVGDFVPSRVR